MEKKRALRIARAAVLLGLALLLVVFPAVGEHSPSEAGPFPFAEYRAELRDEARDRSIDLLLIYPVDARGSPVQSRPLIVFNHGFLLSGDGYRSYGRHLASHGFVVALPTLPMTLWGVHHAEWAADIRFALDFCLGASENEHPPLSGAIDGSRIGASGHSLGGKLSLLEAVADERIRAAALLDPVDGGNPVFPDPERYPSVTPERMSELEIPILLIGAELGSQTVFLTPCAPEGENYERFFEAANPPAIEITQLDVGHGQYVDEAAAAILSTCSIGDVPSDRVRSSCAAYLAAFFLRTLTDSDTALAWLEAQLLLDEAEGRILVRRK